MCRYSKTNTKRGETNMNMSKEQCKGKDCNERQMAKGYCTKCYKRYLTVNIPTFSIDQLKGQTQSMVVNGDAESLKPLIQKIKNNVLNDCIKNPRKYLGAYNNGD